MVRRSLGSGLSASAAGAGTGEEEQLPGTRGPTSERLSRGAPRPG